MTPEHLPTEQYDAQLAEKVVRLQSMMTPFNAPVPEVFRSPVSHYRMRAEFRIWHDGDDLYHIIFDQQTKSRIRVDSFPAASELINQLMTLIMDGVRNNPVLRNKLFQIDYLTTQSNQAIVSLLYHKALNDEWREQAEALIRTCVSDLLTRGPCAVHLLADGVSQRSAAHAVNVMVLALLLGQAIGLQAQQLHGLALSALLHDLGKVNLPAHIGEPGAALRAADMQRYHSHVGLSVELAQNMALPSDVLIAIAQHHEMADGSGYPLHLVADDISRWGQILALVNRYDRLCNPLHGDQALTPHEAVAKLFAQLRGSFDASVLGAFIRLMGVYPPGSLVQLVDGRLAVVMVVDPARPLRPWVVPHQPDVPRSQVALLNLAQTPELGILRSLKPAQLPRAALEYLLPQPRICYFFERALNSLDEGGVA